MAFLPLLLESLKYPSSLADQNFALNILDEIPLAALGSGYIRQWRDKPRSDSGVSSVVCEKDLYSIRLDVQQFKAEEVKVRCEDNFVVIEGKHEEKKDQHGFVSRQFVRRYPLPDTVNKDKIDCELSSDGVLIIKAPLVVKEKPNSNEIPIRLTNQPVKLTLEQNGNQPLEEKKKDEEKVDNAVKKEENAEKKAEKKE